MAAGGGPLAYSPKQEPVQEWAGEVGVRGRPVHELVLKPAGDAFEVLVAFLQDAGVDEELTDAALVPALGGSSSRSSWLNVWPSAASPARSLVFGLCLIHWMAENSEGASASRHSARSAGGGERPLPNGGWHSAQRQLAIQVPEPRCVAQATRKSDTGCSPASPTASAAGP